MEWTRTVVCKLAPTAEQAADINATLRAFAGACGFAADVARRIDSTNKVKVQQDGYQAIRKRFKLSANLAIRAIARACAALKVPAKMHSEFAPTSIDYDARIFAFHEWNWTFGLTLLSGRVRLKTDLGDRQRAMLKGRKPTAATLVKRKDGRYFLHVQLTDAAPEPDPASEFIGVDLGIAAIATDSDGNRHSGQPVDDMRRKHSLQRKRLQRRNTKGAKKKIRRVGSKESRFRRHQNHVISRVIVDAAKRTGRGIALENLKGIRARIRAKGGEARNRLSGWAFAQLTDFVAYKAMAVGVPVVFVNPRDTSKTCAECGHCERSNRKSQARFLCVACGHEADADQNAARNIRSLAQAACNPALELAGLSAQPESLRL